MTQPLRFYLSTRLLDCDHSQTSAYVVTIGTDRCLWRLGCVAIGGVHIAINPLQ